MFFPILSREEIRDWEQQSWKSGVKSEDVIDAVGTELEFVTRELRLSFAHVLILAGKGNNGADALALARSLPASHAQTVIKVSDPIRALEEFKRFTAECRGAKVLLFDGLFGVGLNRPLNSEYTALIRAINSSGFHRISIDVPSGLDDGGKPCPEAVQAHQTYTVGVAKSAFMGGDAADFTGTISVVQNVGLLPVTPLGQFQWSDWSEESEPNRRAESHKGSYGHVAIFAGSKG
ncbi:MAG: carbohydrate kinase, YjeF related protein, partial [Verrucomicrobiales bacterium]|nr:carbohydrate kinase, YjeF related protein [Verrucomicrobiales bacterium]